jgi:hypothetical protein
MSGEIKRIQMENFEIDSQAEAVNHQMHMVVQSIEENKRSVKYHEDLIKTLSKQIAEKLRAKVKVESECKELDHSC